MTFSDVIVWRKSSDGFLPNAKVTVVPVVFWHPDNLNYKRYFLFELLFTL